MAEEQVALHGMRVICIPAADEADEFVAIMACPITGAHGMQQCSRLPIASNANVLDQLDLRDLRQF